MTKKYGQSTQLKAAGRVFQLVLAMITVGCTAKVRNRLCNPNEFEFPAGAEGHYRASVMGTDPRYSGAYVGLSEFDFWIRSLPHSYIVTVPSALARKAGTARIKKDDPGDEVPTPIMPISVCRIGKFHYTEQDNSDGTWSISRFDLSATGISQVGLAFKPDELRAAGFSYRFYPNTEASPSGNWSGGLTGADLIVDNGPLSHEDREKLLSLAHPSGVGIVFSRMPDKGEPSGASGYTSFTLPRKN